MPGEYERVWMHTVTRGGAAYDLDLGVHDRLSATRYLADRPAEGPLLKVAPDAYVAADLVAMVTFTRMEAH